MRRSAFSRCVGARVVLVLVAVVLLFASGGRPARAALPLAKRELLTHYLAALQKGQYEAAFALLSASERKYFGNAGNFGSIFVGDGLRIASFRILGSTRVGNATVAIVSEHVAFFDYALQKTASQTANVVYGIVADGPHFAIKDPYHPWRVLAPAHWSTSANGITATVRKLSFFSGRVELLMTFENRGDATVTILPYGRTVLKDAAGRPYLPIATKLPELTDATLYTGLRLAPSSRYTGRMTFSTGPRRFTPRALTVTFAPIMADGADAPFDLELPSLSVTR